ncbi:tRNA (adenosine(37)-N6)-threonylcarbamoyltransferase complex dimerization subunit type 1 TsaB [Inhella crocodyli]|nr:tRNA (adenosine(37)-N6)-threonylcarbamoyltransferase complex dimerization subunit type 1 TsaB [Inhella crocodyli]
MPMPPPFAPFTASTRLLAMDCAGDTLSLALTEGDAVREARESPGGAQSSDTLLPTAQAMLDALGWTWRDLQGVAFGQGPGAFTGLRTACAVAQGLALGLDRPVMAVDSLCLVAEDAWAQSQGSLRACTVVVDARMGELYHARYARCDAGWTVVRAPGLDRPEALVGETDDGSDWAGNGLALLTPPPGARTWPQQAHRAQALGRLAIAAARSGRWLDAADALPLYVRDKVAQTTAEREQARAQAQPAAEAP